MIRTFHLTQNGVHAFIMEHDFTADYGVILILFTVNHKDPLPIVVVAYLLD